MKKKVKYIYDMIIALSVYQGSLLIIGNNDFWIY